MNKLVGLPVSSQPKSEGLFYLPAAFSQEPKAEVNEVLIHAFLSIPRLFAEEYLRAQGSITSCPTFLVTRTEVRNHRTINDSSSSSGASYYVDYSPRWFGKRDSLANRTLLSPFWTTRRLTEHLPRQPHCASSRPPNRTATVVHSPGFNCASLLQGYYCRQPHTTSPCATTSLPTA